MEKQDKKVVREEIKAEREGILSQIEEWLETPMLVLSFIWLGLFIYEILWNLNPFLETIGAIIWAVFILEFALKFFLAPQKIEYLKDNWLIGISLVLPALRVFRIFRVFRVLQVTRAARGFRLVRLLGSLNIGMNALGDSFSRRGFKYVLFLTVVVMFGGAAGMYTFESARDVKGGFGGYGDALWWTAMLMTTLGGAYTPQTAEGRILNFILALYAFVTFGYITATLATFFVERDAVKRQEEKTADEPKLSEVRTEIAEMRKEIMQILNERRTSS